MAINPGDLSLLIVPNNQQSDILECVLGREMTFDILFSNLSLTDPLYNLSVTLSLPDGVTFISSSIPSSSNTINSSYKNIVSFIDLKDLYPQESNFKLTVTLSCNTKYRSTGKIIDFNTILSGLVVSATADTSPRGSLDSDNTSISTSAKTSFKVLRFSFSISYPPTYLKGAGFNSSSSEDIAKPFNISITLINNTIEESTVDLNINLGNGLRYVDNWESSGTDASTFSDPILIYPYIGQNYWNISFINEVLSKNSTTILSFEAAIWDKYTADGIENSSTTIAQNDSIVSSVSINNDDSSYSESFSIASLELLITKDSLSDITDVDSINTFNLLLEVSQYISVTNFTLTDILPDGLSYMENSSSLVPDSIAKNEDGTSTILWSLEELPSNFSTQITFNSLTQRNYIDGSFVAATDKLTNTASYSAINSITSTPLSGSASTTLTIASPIISKSIIGYYYSDLSEKKYNAAALGDYVRFELVYDATNLVAIQRNTILYDYPPLQMLLTTEPSDIVISGDYPEDASIEFVSNNGFMINLGNLSGGTYFTIQFNLQYNTLLPNNSASNLYKINIRDNENLSTSVRSSVAINFGSPYLRISNTVSNSSCIYLNRTLDFKLRIINSNKLMNNLVTDGFNISVRCIIPNIYSIISSIEVTGDGSYSNLLLSDNVITFFIDNIQPNGTIEVSTTLLVSTTPIMGVSYAISTSITNGTSQQDSNSYKYQYNEYPLSNKLSLTGCTPDITKDYSPSTVKLGDYYRTIISVTIPEGVLGYNNELIDTLISSNTSYIDNVILNDAPTKYILTDDTLKLPLPEVINSTSGEISYTLEYDNRITTVAPTNFEEILRKPSYFNWTTTPNGTRSDSISTFSSLNVLVPNLVLTKEQMNVTANGRYDTAPINADSFDTINYKLTITNTGKSTAYDISLVDILPPALRFLDSSYSYNFNRSTNTISYLIDSLDVGVSTSIIITSRLLNEASDEIASNSSSLRYKANTNLPDYYGMVDSNIVKILRDEVTIRTLQRNLTLDTEFTPSQIRAIQYQSIQYKTIITNGSDYIISNLVVNDYFPTQFNFVSFEKFNEGSLSVNNNVVTAKINSLSPNSSIEFTYTLFLPNESFTVSSSIAKLQYTYINGNNIYTETSNKLFVVSATIGKGFTIY